MYPMDSAIQRLNNRGQVFMQDMHIFFSKNVI